MSDDRDWRQLYPFDSHLLRMAAYSYHYLDEGQGEPLLMLHGNPTWSFYWRRLVAEFRDRYRVVVPDHMGCGMSDKPQQYPYHLQRHIDNLIHLIEHLDLNRITLLAHDWGGAIGLGAALAVPQRFARFVLFNTGAYPPHFVPLRIRLCRLPLLGTFAIRGLNIFTRSALRLATARPSGLTSPVKAGLMAPYDCWARRVAIDQFVRDIPFTSLHPTYRTLRTIEQNLPQLEKRPMQLIWGMKDWCFNASCLERLAAIFPSASIHRLTDAGHYVVEDAHEQVVNLVDQFLQTHPLTDGSELRQQA